MKRKRRFTKVLSVLLCTVLLLAGCGTDTPAETTAAPHPYADLAGTYLCDLNVLDSMSVKMYLQIDKTGNFIFSRENDFSDKAKGAGHLEKNPEGKDTFVYEVVRDAPVKDGEKIAVFQRTEDGGIQFTSLMWFGAAHPRITAEDGTETYPLFMPYDANQEQAEPTETSSPETSAETTQETEQIQETETKPTIAPTEARPAPTEAKPTPTEAKPTPTEAKPAPTEAKPTPTEAKPTPTETQPQPTETKPAPTETTPPETEKPTIPAETTEPLGFREGTYEGSVDKFVEAMDSNIHYDITLTLQGGNYTYQVDITLSGGLDHNEKQSYSGSYSVNGNSLTMTGTLKKAEADGNALTVTGVLSSFASTDAAITLYG